MRNSTLLLFLCIILCPPSVFILGPILLFQIFDGDTRREDEWEYDEDR